MNRKTLSSLMLLLLAVLWGCGPEIIDQLENNLPTARISAPTQSNVSDVVSFDGSQSDDIDGSIASYAWDFGDLATGDGETAQHIFNAGGTFTVTLTVTDNLGGVGVATVDIIVNEGGSVTANIGAPDTAAEGANVRFDGSPSIGAIVRYDWDFGDGTIGAGLQVDHVFAAAGFYDVTLTVYDSNTPASSDSETHTIDIQAGAAGLGGDWLWWLTDESLRDCDFGLGPLPFQNSALVITVNGTSISIAELAGGSIVQTYNGVLTGNDFQVQYVGGFGDTQQILGTFVPGTPSTFTGTYKFSVPGFGSCPDRPVAGSKQ